MNEWVNGLVRDCKLYVDKVMGLVFGDEWINGWSNEWMNEWMIEWMSEWVNERL